MGAPLRVLMIEDSDKDAELVRLEIEKAGFTLDWTRVETESDLLRAFDSGTWDLVISDYRMPSFDGLRAFTLFQDARIDAPFIFVSGALGEERAVEAMRAGARDYVLKDNLARLSVAVTRELQEAKNRRQQKRAEEEARREQLRLAMAVEASGAAIFEHEVPLGPELYHSHRWAEILGLTPDDMPSYGSLVDWILDRLHLEDRPRIEPAYRDFLEGWTGGFQIEGRLRHRDGHWVEVAAFATAAQRDEDGRARSVVGVVLDVTERKRLEEQLRQSQRMEAVGRLAGGVAHDFNNLLTAILSFGDFALDALHRQDPAYEDVSEMLNAAKRAEGLTAQLLAFSRQKPVSPRVININDVVTELERMLRRLLGEDIEVATKLASELGTVRIDPIALEQVIVNLAINARDAMPGGGRLTLETADAEVEGKLGAPNDVAVPTGSYVMLAVCDTGTGIDKEIQARIFEPFFSTKAPGQGTGLGLATCYGIVKQAGGHIWLYSEPGGGTTFKVYLPRISERAENAKESKSEEPLAGSERVLIVEDDEQVRRLAARALSRLGYRVLTAASGGDALILCETVDPIDLLLTDVVMPEMSGLQIAERVAPLQPNMASLFMSGYTANAVADRGVPDPERRLIQKPFTPEELARAVRRALDERAAS